MYGYLGKLLFLAMLKSLFLAMAALVAAAPTPAPADPAPSRTDLPRRPALRARSQVGKVEAPRPNVRPDNPNLEPGQ